MTPTGLLARRALAIIVATSLAVGGTSAFAAGATTSGVLAGRLTDDSKRPFLDYAVQLRDASTGKVLTTAPVNGQGQFTFKEVPLNRRYLVELVRAKSSAVLCTSGPYSASNDQKTMTPVRLGCGRPPAAYWVLAAAAGTGAFYALSNRATGVGAGSVTATTVATGTMSVSK